MWYHTLNMTEEGKVTLKNKILKNNELYELQYSRVRRLLKAPLKTGWFFFRQAIAYLHPYKVTKKTLWGERMSYYLPEGSMIYYYGFFEANLSNFLIDILREGDVVIDIGAHVGFYSMLASELVGESGHVYSFEPTPRTFATLKENASRKRNITVENKAILNEETTIDFFDYGPKYSAFNTFKKRTDEHIAFKDNAEKISVKTLSLDAYVKEKQCSPRFIKIDAEGSEHLILEAMKNILTEIRPIISIEVSSVKEWEDNLKKSLTTLEANGYKAYELDVDGKASPADPYKNRLYDNLIFIHPLGKTL